MARSSKSLNSGGLTIVMNGSLREIETGWIIGERHDDSGAHDRGARSRHHHQHARRDLPGLIQPLFGLPFSGCEGRGLRIECEGVEHVAWVQNHDALPGHLNCMHEGRVQIDESTADLIGHIADGVR
jgi:hypothetical protein